jgi:hypothetical protein
VRVFKDDVCDSGSTQNYSAHNSLAKPKPLATTSPQKTIIILMHLLFFTFTLALAASAAPLPIDMVTTSKALHPAVYSMIFSYAFIADAVHARTAAEPKVTVHPVPNGFWGWGLAKTADAPNPRSVVVPTPTIRPVPNGFWGWGLAKTADTLDPRSVSQPTPTIRPVPNGFWGWGLAKTAGSEATTDLTTTHPAPTPTS